jgi:hypothetical protein
MEKAPIIKKCDGRDLIVNEKLEILRLTLGHHLCSMCANNQPGVSYCEIEEKINELCKLYNITLLVSRCRNCMPDYESKDYGVKEAEYFKEQVIVIPSIDTLRKTECLCLNCENMTGVKENNCPTAQQLFELCCQYNMAFAISKCGDCKPKEFVKR